MHVYIDRNYDNNGQEWTEMQGTQKGERKKRQKRTDRKKRKKKRNRKETTQRNKARKKQSKKKKKGTNKTSSHLESMTCLFYSIPCLCTLRTNYAMRIDAVDTPYPMPMRVMLCYASMKEKEKTGRWLVVVEGRYKVYVGIRYT